jgi:hypothetical protein
MIFQGDNIMTTIEINTIEGRRGSICNNDAYSIVAYEDKSPNVLAFVSAAELHGKRAEQVGEIFARAVADEAPEVVEAVFREALSLRVPEPAL